MVSKHPRWRRKGAGRPRKIDAPREASGKVDRNWSAQQQSEDAMRVGVETRQRMFGLSAEQARSQEGGTVIGRMLLAKDLTADQARTAERYVEMRNAFQRAIGAVPDSGRPPPPPMFETGSGDFDGFCKQARIAWSGVTDTLQAASRETRNHNLTAALEWFIVRDEHVPHLVGDLRIALNVIGRHLSTARRVAA